MAESGGRVRCHNLQKGDLVWDYQPEPGTHALRLAFNKCDNSLVALLWPYVTGGPHSTINFDIASGAQRSHFMMHGRMEFVFLDAGSKILSSDGIITDCASGSICGKLDFES